MCIGDDDVAKVGSESMFCEIGCEGSARSLRPRELPARLPACSDECDEQTLRVVLTASILHMYQGRTSHVLVST